MVLENGSQCDILHGNIDGSIDSRVYSSYTLPLSCASYKSLSCRQMIGQDAAIQRHGPFVDFGELKYTCSIHKKNGKGNILEVPVYHRIVPRSIALARSSTLELPTGSLLRRYASCNMAQSIILRMNLTVPHGSLSTLTRHGLGKIDA